MTPEQYEDELLITQFLIMEEVLYKAIQNQINKTELLQFHEQHLISFPFLSEKPAQKIKLEFLKKQVASADQHLSDVEKEIMLNLREYGGWDFIKDSECFNMMKTLYLQNSEE